MKNKLWIIRISLLIVVVLSIAIYFFYQDDSNYRGQVESPIVPTISEVAGKIVESNITLGQSVKKGDVLAIIDNANQSYEITQLELTLQKKKIALGDVTVGQGGQASNAYLSAQANYTSASLAAEKAANDYEDAKILYSEGAVSSGDLAKAQVSASSASSAKSAALAQLNNALSVTGQSSSQIDVLILENQIKQAKDALDKHTLIAPCDGTIISKNYGEGSVVAPGYNLADIGSSKEVYVVFYVPESQVTEINYDDEVQIEAGEKTYAGKIKYVDVKSQYTPRELLTEANKSKTSFKIQALVSSSTSLKPGMEVTVILK